MNRKPGLRSRLLLTGLHAMPRSAAGTDIPGGLTEVDASTTFGAEHDLPVRRLPAIRVARSAGGSGFEQALDAGRQFQTRARAAPGFMEGPEAFQEKRPAVLRE